MTGLHHVTAVTGDAAGNVSFYRDVLGLRLVKRTVNHDAPESWHLYYGGRTGRPGTTLTFFVWPHLPPGRRGPGQVVEVAFAVPEGTLGWWADRLADHGVDGATEEDVEVGEPGAGGTPRTAPSLAFADPEGLGLRLVAVPEPAGEAPGESSPVPGDRSVRGFHGVTLAVGRTGPTLAVLEEVLGFRPPGGASGGGGLSGAADGRDGGAVRLTADPPGPGRHLRLEPRPDAPSARGGVGTVHHVAVRAADEQEQGRLREALTERGLRPTPPVDRYYFRSVYVREPGGVLLEIATDGPGFTVDEDPDELGRSLALPPWLEDRRDEIEAALPPLEEAGGD